MNLTRISRLLKLLQALRAGNGQNASGIARACGVSRRTVFRDLETLRAAGVPLKFEKDDGRYSIEDDHFLPPTNFTPDEALAIIALATRLGADDGLPFFQPARTAALKLLSNLPASLRTKYLRLSKSIDLRLDSLARLTGLESVYDQLVKAIAARRVVRITYGSLTEWELIETNLRPYQLLFNRRTWYVVGRSSLHKEPRTFNVGRIKSLAESNEKFSMPRGFSIERYLGNAWNMIPQPGPDARVSVRFSPLVAQNVAEVTWHKTQSVRFREDGSLDYSVQVSGLNEIAWWILGYGDQAEVLQPAKLRRLVAQRAKNMCAMYAD
jgi:predicted DNA-binding transcriptional regulator YafY